MTTLGRKFGLYTVIGDCKPKKYAHGYHPYVLCKCDCGTVKKVHLWNLEGNKTKSCGCLSAALLKERSSTHRMSLTPTHIAWKHMRQRCLSKTCNGYPSYGGRGIAICKRWDKFENFFKDMGVRPKGTSLGRIDNNGDYSPDNCRWETPIEQANNKRNNVFIEYDGKRMTMAQWARHMGVHVSMIFNRMKKPAEIMFKEINGWKQAKR